MVLSPVSRFVNRGEKRLWKNIEVRAIVGPKKEVTPMLRKSKIWISIATPVIIAITAGSSSPWWLQLFAADTKKDPVVNFTPLVDQNRTAPPGQNPPSDEKSNGRGRRDRWNRTPAGTWSGELSTALGAYLTGKLMLTDTGAGNVEGQIEWTLRTSQVAGKADKIGRTATEYVKGHYDSASRVLKIDGYDLNDQYSVLDAGKSSYRMQLTGDTPTLTGQAGKDGKWNATVKFKRE